MSLAKSSSGHYPSRRQLLAWITPNIVVRPKLIRYFLATRVRPVLPWYEVNMTCYTSASKSLQSQWQEAHSSYCSRISNSVISSFPSFSNLHFLFILFLCKFIQDEYQQELRCDFDWFCHAQVSLEFSVVFNLPPFDTIWHERHDPKIVLLVSL